MASKLKKIKSTRHYITQSRVKKTAQNESRFAMNKIGKAIHKVAYPAPIFSIRPDNQHIELIMNGYSILETKRHLRALNAIEAAKMKLTNKKVPELIYFSTESMLRVKKLYREVPMKNGWVKNYRDIIAIAIAVNNSVQSYSHVECNGVKVYFNGGAIPSTYLDECKKNTIIETDVFDASTKFGRPVPIELPEGVSASDIIKEATDRQPLNRKLCEDIQTVARFY